MNFKSITGQGKIESFKEAILSGVACDGGLHVPVNLPTFNKQEIASIAQADISTTIEIICNKLFPSDTYKKNVIQALKNSLLIPMPVVRVMDFDVVELFHGPTLSFQDISTKFLSELIIGDSRLTGQNSILIAATTGDTGAAISHAYSHASHIKSIVLFGDKTASPTQRLQMSKYTGNIYPVQVRGTYDDCFKLARRALLDVELSHLNLKTTNSKNIGRLLPNIIVFAYLCTRYPGRSVRFVLPSGEFSNAYACACAKYMGFPIGKTIVATNNNSSVYNYYETGEYKTAQSAQSISYDLDIANPSNFPRIIHLLGNSHTKFRDYFEIHTVSDSKTYTTMQHVYQSSGYLVDPQAALGYAVADASNLEPIDLPIIISLSSPLKFAEVIKSYTGVTIQDKSEQLKKYKNVKLNITEIPNDYESLKEFITTI